MGAKHLARVITMSGCPPVPDPDPLDAENDMDFPLSGNQKTSYY
jgi:hypothetical protein